MTYCDLLQRPHWASVMTSYSNVTVEDPAGDSKAQSIYMLACMYACVRALFVKYLASVIVVVSQSDQV